MSKAAPFLLSACLAIALAGCGNKSKPAPPPPVVTVATPLQQTLVDWDDYTGQFIAVDSVDIRPRVTGYLQSVAFKDGDYVRKGQVLFVIDPRPYQAVLDQAKGAEAHAQAALTNARTEAARGATLLAAKAISQQAYDTLVATERQATADMLSAQANVHAAALNVGFTRVTAPLSGKISDRRVAPGNLVTADTTVLTNIVNLDPIRFEFTGSEALFLKYQRGQGGGLHTAATPVQIKLQDEPTYRWNGKLDFVDNAIQPGSGAIRGRAVISNPQHFLTPGMFGHMRLMGSQPYQALLVPDAALTTDLSRQVAYVVGPDRVVAERVVVEGPLYNGLRVIRSGLQPGDRVIVDGIQRAKPGQKVSLRNGRIAVEPIPPAGPGAGFIAPLPSSATPPDQITAP
ncbi:efflux RND transporter periplasmic adaptor subunit [Caulobacter sp. KR2-114]|uniref:efflux RND transporter periplasmic adaptor subunit n=1 Tax=Caulobacter sp. KR2-114 TaxID=3400912 RepID=UPI003C0B5C0E